MFLAEQINSTGHVINGKSRIGEVTSEDLVAEAKTWGLPARLAQRTVESTFEAVRAAIAATPALPVLAPMLDNLDAFWSRRA